MLTRAGILTRLSQLGTKKGNFRWRAGNLRVSTGGVGLKAAVHPCGHPRGGAALEPLTSITAPARSPQRRGGRGPREGFEAPEGSAESFLLGADPDVAGPGLALSVSAGVGSAFTAWASAGSIIADVGGSHSRVANATGSGSVLSISAGARCGMSVVAAAAGSKTPHGIRAPTTFGSSLAVEPGRLSRSEPVLVFALSGRRLTGGLLCHNGNPIAGDDSFGAAVATLRVEAGRTLVSGGAAVCRQRQRSPRGRPL